MSNSFAVLGRLFYSALVLLPIGALVHWFGVLVFHVKQKNAYSDAAGLRYRRVRTVFLVIAIVMTVLSLAAWGIVLCFFGDMAPTPIPVS